MSNRERGYRIIYNEINNFTGLREIPDDLTNASSIPTQTVGERPWAISVGGATANVYIIPAGSGDTASGSRYASGTYSSKSDFDPRNPPSLYSDGSTGAACYITIMERN